MAKKKENRVVVCPFGVVGLENATRMTHSSGAIQAFPITESMCLARRTKGYFAGCAECGWWRKRRKAAAKVAEMIVKKDSGVKEKDIKCPECGALSVIRVDGVGGDFLMCMGDECSWDKGEPFARPPTAKEVAKPNKKKVAAKKRAVKKSAAGVAPKSKGGTSTGNKVKDKKGRTRSTGVGDEVAMKLVECADIAAMVKYAIKMGVKDAKKYLSLPNPGLARMAMGNRIRGVLRNKDK